MERLIIKYGERPGGWATRSQSRKLQDSGMFYKMSSVKIVRTHRLVEGESPQSPRLTAPVTTFYYRRPRCATVGTFYAFPLPRKHRPPGYGRGISLAPYDQAAHGHLEKPHRWRPTGLGRGHSRMPTSTLGTVSSGLPSPLPRRLWDRGMCEKACGKGWLSPG